MQLQNTAASPETITGAIHGTIQPHAPSLLTLTQLCEVEPALTPGGLRHLIFTKGHDLPGIYRFGRKILFDRAEFVAGIKAGETAVIATRPTARPSSAA